MPRSRRTNPQLRSICLVPSANALADDAYSSIFFFFREIVHFETDVFGKYLSLANPHFVGHQMPTIDPWTWKRPQSYLEQFLPSLIRAQGTCRSRFHPIVTTIHLISDQLRRQKGFSGESDPRILPKLGRQSPTKNSIYPRRFSEQHSTSAVGPKQILCAKTEAARLFTVGKAYEYTIFMSYA